MTLQTLTAALGQGYSISQVIKSILQMKTPLAKAIKEALKQGYNEDQIEEYLTKGKSQSFSQRNQQLKDMTEEEKARGILYRQPKSEKNIGNILKTAAMTAPLAAAGAYAGPAISSALGGAASGAMGALQRAAPQLLGAGAIPGAASTLAQSGVLGQNPTAPTGQQTALPSGQQSLQPPVNPPTIPQAASAMQSQGNLTSIIAKAPGYKEKIDELLKAGNGPEQIAGFLSKFDPKTVKELEKEAKAPIKDIVEAYVKEAGNAPQAMPAEAPEVEKEEVPIAESKPIAKGETVVTPHGVGEVKEIRNGQAIIEDEHGKKHKVDVDELEAEPQEVREAKFEFDPSTVPEELRSAPLNEVYLPYDKRHVTVKYNAGLKPIRYLYFRKDGQSISNDYINKIVQGLQLPVSSGNSFWGTWNADKSDSRGAANYEELVKNSQEEGEKDDPSKEYWFIKEEALYEHPYMEKAGKEELRRKEKEFNESKKKRKKKTA